MKIIKSIPKYVDGHRVVYGVMYGRNTNGVYKKCKYCGKEFFVSLYLYKKNNPEFCNMSCKKHYNCRIKFLSHPPKICKICYKSFTPRSGYEKYCSKKCAGIALRKRVDITCSQCGKKYQIQQSIAKKQNNHFCSIECWNKWRSINYKGKGNPCYRHGKHGTKQYNHDKNKAYRNSVHGHRIVMKHINRRRRNFGYNELNDRFENSIGHHININDVIYIPEQLHKFFCGYSVINKSETRKNKLIALNNSIAYILLIEYLYIKQTKFSIYDW